MVCLTFLHVCFRRSVSSFTCKVIGLTIFPPSWPCIMAFYIRLSCHCSDKTRITLFWVPQYGCFARVLPYSVNDRSHVSLNDSFDVILLDRLYSFKALLFQGLASFDSTYNLFDIRLSSLRWQNLYNYSILGTSVWLLCMCASLQCEPSFTCTMSIYHVLVNGQIWSELWCLKWESPQ